MKFKHLFFASALATLVIAPAFGDQTSNNSGSGTITMCSSAPCDFSTITETQPDYLAVIRVQGKITITETHTACGDSMEARDERGAVVAAFRPRCSDEH